MPSPSMNEDGNGGDDNDDNDDDDESDDDDDNDDDEISSLLSSPDCSRLSQKSQGVGPPRLSCKHLPQSHNHNPKGCCNIPFYTIVKVAMTQYSRNVIEATIAFVPYLYNSSVVFVID